MGRPHTQAASTDQPSTPPAITHDDVRTLTDSQSFSRGTNYQRRGMIYDTSQRGTQIRAMCEGSSGGPYHVQATLAAANQGADPIVDWSCDCPRGGFCKHVVALVLTWIESPDAFDARPPLAELLATKSREDLVAHLENLATRLPEADEMIERLVPLPVVIPPPESVALTERTVDLGAIRRKADTALKPFRTEPWNDVAYDLVDPFQIAEELNAICGVGDRYAAAGRWADAQSVYETVADRLIEQYNESFDPEHVVLQVIAACGQGLLRCLDAQPELPASDRLPSAARADLLAAIIRLWRYEHEGPTYEGAVIFGAPVGYPQSEPPPPPIDLSAFYDDDTFEGEDEDEAEELGWIEFRPGPVFARAASGPERARIEQQLRELVTPDAPRVSHALRRAAIQFLLDLQGQDDDEARLAAYTAAGLWADVVALQVRQGKIHEAVALAARTLTTSAATLAFANFLAQRGGELPRQAIAFVEDRLWETEGKNQLADSHYRHWLSQAYARHGNADKAFDLVRREFEALPGYPTFLAVKTAASLPGQAADLWERTRPELMQELEKRGDLATLLAAHLDAGEVREALATFERMEEAPKVKASGILGGSYEVPARPYLESYRPRLAAAAEQDFPREAISLYLSLAEKQIENRNRGSYKQAAEYLKQVKQLYATLGETETWQASIAELREKHKRLRALQEELDAARLR